MRAYGNFERNNTAPSLRRPADRSLAYKEFVLPMTLALDPNAKDEWSEQQWREAWEEFGGRRG